MRKEEKFLSKVKTMLGHPTVSVELTAEQAKEALRSAQSVFKMKSSLAPIKDLANIKRDWVDQYATAEMLRTLGFVRGKFVMQTPGSEMTTNYERLFEQANREQDRLLGIISDFRFSGENS